MAATNDADAYPGHRSGCRCKETPDSPPTARMFYVAYFKKDVPPESRPVTFIYNGGPGSSTMWLHMGAFGPRRVVTADDQHTSPAPYELVDNTYSLLDASDLVFIDAPGTGFGRLFGKDKEKAFWGVDPDAHAFARFIARFLSTYQRWNSPKYLFGESYGTTRSAVLAGILETENHIDLNGVILLSQILNFDDSADAPQWNPGIDLPYELALPTFAATAYYHKRLPTQPAALLPFLAEVEQFAWPTMLRPWPRARSCPTLPARPSPKSCTSTPGCPWPTFSRPTCASTLVNSTITCKEMKISPQAGWTAASPDQPSTRWLRKLLTTRRPPLSHPLSIAAFNDYIRRQLKFGEGLTYLPESDAANNAWEFKHKAPGAPGDSWGVNVMPDLATAMKYNPRLKVMLNGGYFDLATPYFAARYEMSHLRIPANLRQNIQFAWYQSGHMVYLHEDSLKATPRQGSRLYRQHLQTAQVSF